VKLSSQHMMEQGSWRS